MLRYLEKMGARIAGRCGSRAGERELGPLCQRDHGHGGYHRASAGRNGWTVTW